MTVRKTQNLNRFQKAVAQHYGQGDFSYVETLSESQGVGDGLFSFLMRELADDGEPMTHDVASRRMAVVIGDVQTVADNLPD